MADKTFLKQWPAIHKAKAKAKSPCLVLAFRIAAVGPLDPGKHRRADADN